MSSAPSSNDIQALCHYLAQTVDADVQKRKQAEAFLTSMIPKPGFPILLLHILELKEVSEPIRQAGAVFFKNLVKIYWTNKESISANDRQQIKANIVTLLLTSPPVLQKQLSSSLELISESDFPAEWSNLLPELISKLGSPDVSVINGVLGTLHAIFKRYRHSMKSPAVLEELKYVLQILAQPLLELFKTTSMLIDQNAQSADVLKVLFHAVKQMLKIFYSLNSIDLPEYFEDHMQEWMSLFRKYLNYQTGYVQLVGSPDDEKASLLDKVQTCICLNINLYLEKYEEEFSPFLSEFLTDVWTLLVNKTNSAPKYDGLISAAIRFLTSVTTGVHFTLFKDLEILKSICEKVVLPNLQLRDDPVEYIRRDIEGSDSDTRRRSATELVKGLRKHYEQPCTQICSAYLVRMLQEYSADPKKNWKSKDVAIYLVTALAVRSLTASQGPTSINQLVPVMDFFANQILPEIQSSESAALILRADALKFVSTFRHQIPKDAYNTLLPLLNANLLNPNYVVHTYAAACIERLLTVKDKASDGVTLIPRLGRGDLQPYLATSLTNLFKVLSMDQSKENDYVMKAVMRVVLTAQEDVLPFFTEVITRLNSILIEVSKNPKNPVFNHYLFETIAAVIKNVSTKGPEAVMTFEKLLFEPFQFILSSDVQEFSPYVFQIMAMLLELMPSSTLTPAYVALFSSLLSPALWERQGNIPALVRLLQAYLLKGAPQIVAQNQLLPVLGIFQKLIASKVHDHEGFYLLESVVDSLPAANFAPHMQQVFTLIFTRLQKDKTPKFIKSFLVFLSLFINRHGPTVVLQQIDTVQKDLFVNILDSLWFPNIQKVNGIIERKMAALAMTKLLTECPTMLVVPYFPQQWMKLLTAILTLFAGSPEEAEQNSTEPTTPDTETEEDIQGYTNAFSQLSQAIKANQDPFKDIEPKSFFVISLYKLCRSAPQKFPSVIETALGVDGTKMLVAYFQSVPSLQPPYLV